ncbi:winged helix-turn-helix transcriptional regulator [Ferruginivarius sediminum]|uniref:Transcriptional regulator n=1 Tax=Ferruginivarius sediminum TaxID=2661937 RepID=A0A369TEF4_9PROT|nr:helix-turn-helix domain-containing protein [Ferruginivarius sediminum]RDD61316.1 transcriptional regulator [Ferruginivarius sediminum]
MRKGYGQFCPVAKAAEIFCERWNALLFRELGAGSKRFSELQRGVPLMSPSMLSRRLKELEQEGVIERHADAGRSATYHLTPAGEEFLPLVFALGTWGQRWTRRQLRDDEIDVGLLLWDMERTVRADAFAQQRAIVQLEFSDLPPGQRTWWFVNDGGAVQLCLQDPGFEVDLYLTVTVRDMIHIWRGDLTLRRALDEARLDAHGPRRLVRALGAWLNLGPLAGIPSARADHSTV